MKPLAFKKRLAIFYMGILHSSAERLLPGVNLNAEESNVDAFEGHPSNDQASPKTRSLALTTQDIDLLPIEDHSSNLKANI